MYTQAINYFCSDEICSSYILEQAIKMILFMYGYSTFIFFHNITSEQKSIKSILLPMCNHY